MSLGILAGLWLAPTASAQNLTPLDFQNNPTLPLQLDLNQDKSDKNNPNNASLLQQDKNTTPAVDTGEIKDESGTLSDEAETKFYLREILLSGVTVFKAEDLGEILSSKVSREASAKDLQEILDNIKQLYHSKGYITTFVQLRGGLVEDGVIHVDVYEGTVAARVTHGLKRAKPKYVEREIRLQAGDVFNYQTLYQDLAKLNSHPMFKSVKAKLTPGEEPLTSNIELDVEEPPLLQANYSFDNQGRSTIGLYRSIVGVQVNNPSGHGDSLATNLVLATNMRTVGAMAQYRYPLSLKHSTYVGLDYGYNSIDLDDPLDEPNDDITGRSYNGSLVAEGQLFKNDRFTVMGDVRASFFESYIFFNNIPLRDFLRQEFRFSRIGDPRLLSDPQFRRSWYFNVRRENEAESQTRDPFQYDHVRTLSYGITAQEQDQKGRSVVRTSVEHGLKLFGGNRAFTRINVDATRLQFLPHGLVLILRGQGQWADGRLPGQVQYQLGGANSVRGYREGLLVGDKGYNIGAELRFPFYLVPKAARHRVQGVLFAEHGATYVIGEDVGLEASGIRGHLTGFGSGLRINFSDTVSGRVDFGFATTPDKSANRPWVHFGLNAQLF